MIPEIFADGIGRIGFADGMVRIELISRSAGALEGGEEVHGEVRHRVVMTAQAFVQSLIVQQKALAKLEEAGVIRRTSPSGEPPLKVVDRVPAGPPRSPNFSSE